MIEKLLIDHEEFTEAYLRSAVIQNRLALNQVIDHLNAGEEPEQAHCPQCELWQKMKTTFRVND